MMNKEKTLIGIVGLLAGIIIGYIGANYINNTYGPASTQSMGASTLPQDHPPTDTRQSSAADEDVMAVINRARNEPGDFSAQMQAAALYSRIGRNDQALEFLMRAQQIKPDDYELLVALGNTTFDLKRYEEAETWYQKALQSRTDDPTIRMDLGLTYYLRRPPDLDRAITEYRKALTLDPNHEKTLQNMVAALIDKGDMTQARSFLQRLEQANPSNQALPQFRDKIGR